MRVYMAAYASARAAINYVTGQLTCYTALPKLKKHCSPSVQINNDTLNTSEVSQLPKPALTVPLSLSHSQCS